MRFSELLVEDVKIGGFQIQISPHVHDQAVTRGISREQIIGMLQRLPRLKRQILEIEPGVKFNIYDSTTHVHLGITRSLDNPDKLYFNTVYKNPRYVGRNPLLKIREEVKLTSNPSRILSK